MYVSDEDALREAQHLVIATRWVRDLVNTPAADMMPEHLAAAAETIAAEFGAHLRQVIGDDLLTYNFPDDSCGWPGQRFSAPPD